MSINQRKILDDTVDSNKKTLFVTVGSTKFELLINTVLKDETLKQLRKYGFQKLIMQVGNGKHEDEHLLNLSQAPVKFYKSNIEVHAYCYKSTLRDDLFSADMVISHAGSGSIIESLEAKKRLIVVVNESLMDNHQFELAEKMYDLGYLLYTTCDALANKIDLINNPEFSLTSYVPGNPKLFGKFLDSILA